MQNMTEILASAIGMQWAKVRRCNAELLFRLLTDLHVGTNVGYDNAYTVTVGAITVNFGAATVNLTAGFLPGVLKVKADWNTVQQLITVVDGLLLIAARIPSPLDGTLFLREGLSDSPDTQDEQGTPEEQDELAWTAATAPAPDCCGKPMTERVPEVWGTPGDGLYVERIYRCACCGTYQYREVTDTTEAALLYTEVTPW